MLLKFQVNFIKQEIYREYSHTAPAWKGEGLWQKKHYFMKWADEFLQRLRVRVLKPKRQIKDVVFRLIFGKNKEALLELYNALNGTNYTDVNDLIVATLDNAIYVSMKNDLAFLLAGTINMYEHQSTVNPNMPVRFFDISGTRISDAD